MTTVTFEALQKAWGRRLLALAQQQGVAIRIERAYRASQVLTYVLRLAAPTDLERLLRLAEPAALALGVDSLRLARYRGAVLAEVALPERWHTPLHLAQLRPAAGAAAVLGESVLKQPVALSLESPLTPHVLVAGTTGSGKTVLLRTLLTQLVRQNPPERLRLIVLDGKGDLRPFARVPHLLHPIAGEPAEYLALLSWAVAELDRRKAQPAPWRLVVVVDELAEVLNAAGGADGPAAECLRRLAALGRSLGINLVVATQYPNAQTLGGAIAKANLPARAVGRVLDAQASALACGQAGLDAHKLRGKGDFLLVAGSEAQRLQVAVPSERELAELPRTGRVEALDLSEYTPDGALRATPASQAPDPLTPQQVAWALAHSMGALVGIGKLKAGLGIGSKKAERLQAFARDLITELDALGCGVYRNAEEVAT